MIVSHKSKDIGILKSIGVSEANIVGVFVIFAFWTGLLGSGIGVVLGVAFLRNINTIESRLFEHLGFQLWDRTIYAIGDIPNQTDAGLLAVVVLSAVVSCMLSALLPSRQAAKQEPVEILQVSQL
jgi:lipoprotein-releasing system permease protein